MTEGACPDLQNSRRSITGSSYIIEKHDCGLYRYDYAKESAALYALEKELSLESSAKLLADADATELFEDLKVKAKEIEDQTCISPKSMKRVLKITR